MGAATQLGVASDDGPSVRSTEFRWLAPLLLCCLALSAHGGRNSSRDETVVNVLVGVFAILLCVINATVWTFITGLPLVGVAWVLGAAACVKLQKWSR
jgi:hypothetical protein